MAETHWPVLCWLYSHLSSRVESQGPIIRGLSGLSRSCLNGILIVSCFLCCCFLLFCLFSGVCPLSTRRSLSWHWAHHWEWSSPIFFPHQSPRRKVTCGTVSAVNKRAGRWTLRQAIPVQSISFQDCTPTIEKALFVSVLRPRQAVSMATGTRVIVLHTYRVYRPIHIVPSTVRGACSGWLSPP